MSRRQLSASSYDFVVALARFVARRGEFSASRDGSKKSDDGNALAFDESENSGDRLSVAD
jgi:hypothetical protein